MAAASKGLREIGFAVIAMTLTLAAVFAPIAFTPGKTGRLFLEFALTLAGAVIISGLVALALTPMMSARLLRHQEQQCRIYTLLERLFTGLETGYKRALTGALTVKPLILLIAAGTAVLSGFLFTSLKSELSPLEDRGVIRIRGTGPEGATVAYTERYATQLEGILASVPETRGRLAISGAPEVSQA
jgi:multidrug efflux pump